MTHINDLSSFVLVKSILSPQTLDAENPTGSAADLGEGDGPCFAVQVIGAVSGDAELTGRIEESHDNSTWVSISGAEFTPAAESGLQIIRFHRSRRYVRWAAAYEPDEGDSVAAAAIVQQCKKTA